MEKAKSIPLQAASRVHRDQLVTLGDLQEFKEELLLSIRSIIQTNSSPAVKKWLKSYEVRKLLNISKGTLQTFRANGTIPFTKMGGLIYYDTDAINKVLAGKKFDFTPNPDSLSKKTSSRKKL